MPRVQKLLMLKHLPLTYERVCTASGLLGMNPPQPYDLSKCSFNQNEYLVLRASDGALVAMCYVGDSSKKFGHIIMNNGHELNEHEYLLLTGSQVNDQGVVPGCDCAQCTKRLVQQQAKAEEERLTRYDERALIIGQAREKKINSVSPSVAERLDLSLVPLKPTNMTKVTQTTFSDNDKRRAVDQTEGTP